MTNENYRLCKTCRFCHHTENDWVCFINNRMTSAAGTCVRYRPGCCETCSNLLSENGLVLCSVTGEEAEILSVCSDYDPGAKPLS